MRTWEKDTPSNPNPNSEDAQKKREKKRQIFFTTLLQTIEQILGFLELYNNKQVKDGQTNVDSASTTSELLVTHVSSSTVNNNDPATQPLDIDYLVTNLSVLKLAAKNATQPGLKPQYSLSNLMGMYRCTFNNPRCTDDISKGIKIICDLILLDIQMSEEESGSNFTFIDIEPELAVQLINSIIEEDTKSPQNTTGQLIWRICFGLKLDLTAKFIDENPELIQTIQALPSYQAYDPFNTALDSRNVVFYRQVLQYPCLFVIFAKTHLIYYIYAMLNELNQEKFVDQNRSLGTAGTTELSEDPTVAKIKHILITIILNPENLRYTRRALNMSAIEVDFIEAIGIHEEIIAILEPLAVLKLFQSVDSWAYKKAMSRNEVSDNAKDLRRYKQFDWLFKRIIDDIMQGDENYFIALKKIPYLLYNLVTRNLLVYIPPNQLYLLFKGLGPEVIKQTLQLLDPEDTENKDLMINFGTYATAQQPSDEPKYDFQCEVDKTSSLENYQRFVNLLSITELQVLRDGWVEDSNAYGLQLETILDEKPPVIQLLLDRPFLLKNCDYFSVDQLLKNNPNSNVNAVIENGINPFMYCPFLFAFVSDDAVIELYNKHYDLRKLFDDKILPPEVVITFIIENSFAFIAKAIPVLEQYVTPELFKQVDQRILHEGLLKIMLSDERLRQMLKSYPSILNRFQPLALTVCAKDSAFLRQILRQNVFISIILDNLTVLIGENFGLLKNMIQVLYLNPETSDLFLTIKAERPDPDFEEEKQNPAAEIQSADRVKKKNLETDNQSSEDAKSNNPDEKPLDLKEIKRIVKVKPYSEQSLFSDDIRLTDSSITISPQNATPYDPLLFLVEVIINDYPAWTRRFIQSEGFLECHKKEYLGQLGTIVDINSALEKKREGEENTTDDSSLTNEKKYRETEAYFSAVYSYASLLVDEKNYQKAAKYLMSYLETIGLSTSNNTQSNPLKLLTYCADCLVATDLSNALNYYIFATQIILSGIQTDIVKLVRNSVLQSANDYHAYSAIINTLKALAIKQTLLIDFVTNLLNILEKNNLSGTGQSLPLFQSLDEIISAVAIKQTLLIDFVTNLLNILKKNNVLRTGQNLPLFECLDEIISSLNVEDPNWPGVSIQIQLRSRLLRLQNQYFDIKAYYTALQCKNPHERLPLILLNVAQKKPEEENFENVFLADLAKLMLVMHLVVKQVVTEIEPEVATETAEKNIIVEHKVIIHAKESFTHDNSNLQNDPLFILCLLSLYIMSNNIIKNNINKNYTNRHYPVDTPINQMYVRTLLHEEAESRGIFPAIRKRLAAIENKSVVLDKVCSRSPYSPTTGITMITELKSLRCFSSLSIPTQSRYNYKDYVIPVDNTFSLNLETSGLQKISLTVNVKFYADRFRQLHERNQKSRENMPALSGVVSVSESMFTRRRLANQKAAVQEMIRTLLKEEERLAVEEFNHPLELETMSAKFEEELEKEQKLKEEKRKRKMEKQAAQAAQRQKEAEAAEALRKVEEEKAKQTAAEEGRRKAEEERVKQIAEEEARKQAEEEKAKELEAAAIKKKEDEMARMSADTPELTVDEKAKSAEEDARKKKEEEAVLAEKERMKKFDEEIQFEQQREREKLAKQIEEAKKREATRAATKKQGEDKQAEDKVRKQAKTGGAETGKKDKDKEKLVTGGPSKSSTPHHQKTQSLTEKQKDNDKEDVAKLIEQTRRDTEDQERRMQKFAIVFQQHNEKEERERKQRELAEQEEKKKRDEEETRKREEQAKTAKELEEIAKKRQKELEHERMQQRINDAALLSRPTNVLRNDRSETDDPSPPAVTNIKSTDAALTGNTVLQSPASAAITDNKSSGADQTDQAGKAQSSIGALNTASTSANPRGKTAKIITSSVARDTAHKAGQQSADGSNAIQSAAAAAREAALKKEREASAEKDAKRAAALKRIQDREAAAQQLGTAVSSNNERIPSGPNSDGDKDKMKVGSVLAKVGTFPSLTSSPASANSSSATMASASSSSSPTNSSRGGK